MICLLYFYPRSPCGERQPSTTRRLTNKMISIHALLAESDREPTALRTPHHRFLSTLSLRRATLGLPATSLAHRDFYPRSPCGERPILDYFSGVMRQFLSTLSLRRATYKRSEFSRDNRFLSTLSLRRATFNASCSKPIHAFLSTLSLRRATLGLPATSLAHRDFYPRSPCGERRNTHNSAETV